MGVEVKSDCTTLPYMYCRISARKKSALGFRLDVNVRGRSIKVVEHSRAEPPFLDDTIPPVPVPAHIGVFPQPVQLDLKSGKRGWRENEPETTLRIRDFGGDLIRSIKRL